MTKKEKFFKNQRSGIGTQDGKVFLISEIEVSGRISKDGSKEV